MRKTDIMNDNTLKAKGEWAQYHVVTAKDAPPFCPVRWHEEAEALRVLAGEGALYADGVKYPLKKGDCAVILPFVMHSIEGNGNFCFEAIIIDVRAAGEREEKVRSQAHLLNGGGKSALCRGMDEAFDEWEGAKNKWWQGHNVYPPKRFGYAEDFPQWHRADLEAMICRDRNHPSLLIWTPMNEEWWPDRVQYPRLAADLYDLTKALDPTRPFHDASGGVHVKTDIWSFHNYEQNPEQLKKNIANESRKQEVRFKKPGNLQGNPQLNIGFNAPQTVDEYSYPAYDGTVPFLIDEVGGIKWVKGQDKGNTGTSWGYGEAPKSEQEFIERLRGQIGVVLELHEQVWGYCYTQLTDVEQEQNGIYYYDRTPKFDMKLIHAIFSQSPKEE